MQTVHAEIINKNRVKTVYDSFEVVFSTPTNKILKFFVLKSFKPRRLLDQYRILQNKPFQMYNPSAYFVIMPQSCEKIIFSMTFYYFDDTKAESSTYNKIKYATWIDLADFWDENYAYDFSKEYDDNEKILED